VLNEEQLAIGNKLQLANKTSLKGKPNIYRGIDADERGLGRSR
jgi:hypothetical protein